MSEQAPAIDAADRDRVSEASRAAAVEPAGAATTTATATATEEPLADDDLVVPTWYRLEFEARVAQFYFGRRRVWFEDCSRMARMLTLGLSSSAVAGWLTSLPWLLTFGTIATALVSIAVVAFDLSGQQKRYEDGYRKVTDILQKIMIRRLSSASWQTRLELRHEYDAITAIEPRTLAALSVDCVNYNLGAEGFPRDQLYHIPWYQRWTCQVIAWSGPYETIAERDARRSKQPA